MLQDIRRFFFLLGPVFLTGCGNLDSPQKHDPAINLDREDYKKKLTDPSPVSMEKLVRPIPQHQPETKKYNPSLEKAVSLSTTTELPLKDVFLSLARQADINIVLDPRIQGGITFHGKNRKFLDLVREICQMSGLRFKIVNDMVCIEPDTPHLKNYNIPYLTMTRENQSRISIATDVFSGVDGRNTEMDNGSSNLLSGNSKNDFWSELEQNIATILSLSPGTHTSQSDSRYSIHRHGGVISIMATEAQHTQIREYLRLLEQNIATQVLIEAKIVEINLKDEFRSGINWNTLKGDFVLQAPMGRVATSNTTSSTALRDVFTIGGTGHHLTGLLSLMQRFGTVRTLSSPRLTVMNNQSAVLKVATNQVFFRMDYDREYGYQSTREREHVSSEIQTVPIGLVMVVHPSINPETGSIIMTLRPTISRVVEEKEDPAVSIVSKQTQKSLIPQVQVRELDSVINMKSGEIVILGGLMEERSDNEQSGLPEVSNIPLIGELFKGKGQDRIVTELVIFLKATIVEGYEQVLPVQGPTVTPADQNVYETFTRDPRPLDFQSIHQ